MQLQTKQNKVVSAFLTTQQILMPLSKRIVLYEQCRKPHRVVFLDGEVLTSEYIEPARKEILKLDLTLECKQ